LPWSIISLGIIEQGCCKAPFLSSWLDGIALARAWLLGGSHVKYVHESLQKCFISSPLCQVLPTEFLGLSKGLCFYFLLSE
jgi:hypothetical protein